MHPLLRSDYTRLTHSATTYFLEFVMLTFSLPSRQEMPTLPTDCRNFVHPFCTYSNEIEKLVVDQTYRFAIAQSFLMYMLFKLKTKSIKFLESLKGAQMLSFYLYQYFSLIMCQSFYNLYVLTCMFVHQTSAFHHVISSRPFVWY